MSLDILKKSVTFSLKIFLTRSYNIFISGNNYSYWNDVSFFLLFFLKKSDKYSPREIFEKKKQKKRKQNTIANTEAELVLRIFLIFCPIWAWIFL